jgi:2-polyprenyl-3-methyl-5-hydroxy-6-metoxy-1,4-benzoquinol methylase
MVLKLPPLDARIPKWNLDDLTERSCPICNSPDADTAYERPDDLNVRLCKKCNTFFVSPSPSDEQLQAFYEVYDEKHRRALKISAKELAASYKGADPFTDLRIRELSSLLKFEASRVLDIGFGRAYFLYCLKKLGAIPYGLELDTQAIEFAKFLGIENVFQGNMADFVSETKFDLITLIDLVEHPLNPMDLLRKSSELMQRGGFLLIWTPNGDFASLEKSPTTFRVDLEHMQYFTPDTCIFIASELKLRVAHLETLGFPWLEGIDKPLSKNETHARHLKRIIKSIPGFSTINNFRHKLFAKEQDERSGAYHLFCIMQKPAF